MGRFLLDSPVFELARKIERLTEPAVQFSRLFERHQAEMRRLVDPLAELNRQLHRPLAPILELQDSMQRAIEPAQRLSKLMETMAVPGLADITGSMAELQKTMELPSRLAVDLTNLVPRVTLPNFEWVAKAFEPAPAVLRLSRALEEATEAATRAIGFLRSFEWPAWTDDDECFAAEEAARGNDLAALATFASDVLRLPRPKTASEARTQLAQVAEALVLSRWKERASDPVKYLQGTVSNLRSGELRREQGIWFGGRYEPLEDGEESPATRIQVEPLRNIEELIDQMALIEAVGVSDEARELARARLEYRRPMLTEEQYQRARKELYRLGLRLKRGGDN